MERGGGVLGGRMGVWTDGERQEKEEEMIKSDELKQATHRTWRSVVLRLDILLWTPERHNRRGPSSS